MAGRGRPKKLPILEKLEGNPSKRPIVDFGIDALGDAFVPEHLSDDARGCVEVIKRSMPPRVYRALDSFILSAYATAWAIHKCATHQINNPEFAWIVTNSAGSLTPNPWLRVINTQAQLMATLGDRLGLDPKSRAALKLPAQKPRSKFDGLLGSQNEGRALSS